MRKSAQEPRSSMTHVQCMQYSRALLACCCESLSQGCLATLEARVCVLGAVGAWVGVRACLISMYRKPVIFIRIRRYINVYGCICISGERDTQRERDADRQTDARNRFKRQQRSLSSAR